MFLEIFIRKAYETVKFLNRIEFTVDLTIMVPEWYLSMEILIHGMNLIVLIVNDFK